MSSSACSKILVLIALLAPTSSWAFTPPRIGQQHLTLGVTSEPGVFFDDTAPEGISDTAVAWSERIRLGFQHAVHTNFYASAELELGATYFRPNTASADGVADSELALSWQAAVAGRFYPSGDDGGWNFGGAISLARFGLDEAPLYVMGFDLRTGWLFWFGQEFSFVEVGYTVPFIQGMAFATDFTGMAERQTQDWSFHRLFISLGVGF